VSNLCEKGDKSPLVLPNKNKSTTDASSQQTCTGSASTEFNADEKAKIDDMNNTERISVDDLLLTTTCHTGHSCLITYTTIFSQNVSKNNLFA
jgi:hypothetical protein